jgi:DNA-binding MarR family transcriptional regulator
MDDELYAVLRAYPAIYMACHVEHRSRAQSSTGLTSREASILAHVEPQGARPAALARHLGVAASTLSASLARLAAGGFLTIEVDGTDARRRVVRLTASGREAVAVAGVLDPDRVAALLKQMGPEERARAVAGLVRLAQAAREMRGGEAG